MRIASTSASFNGRPVTAISFEYSSELRLHKILSVIHAEDTKTRTSVISEQNKLVGFMYLMRGQHWTVVAGVEMTETLGEVETKNKIVNIKRGKLKFTLKYETRSVRKCVRCGAVSGSL